MAEPTQKGRLPLKAHPSWTCFDAVQLLEHALATVFQPAGRPGTRLPAATELPLHTPGPADDPTALKTSLHSLDP
ncbi:MAG: hypothetical protein AAF851_12005 [Myxococcota bacterium]